MASPSIGREDGEASRKKTVWAQQDKSIDITFEI